MVSRADSRSRAGGRRRPLVRRRSRFFRSSLGWLAAIACALASTAAAAGPAESVRYTRPPAKVPPVKDPKTNVDDARKAAAEVPSGPSSAGAPSGRPLVSVKLAVIDDQLKLLEALLHETDPA